MQQKGRDYATQFRFIQYAYDLVAAQPPEARAAALARLAGSLMHTEEIEGLKNPLKVENLLVAFNSAGSPS